MHRRRAEDREFITAVTAKLTGLPQTFWSRRSSRFRVRTLR